MGEERFWEIIASSGIDSTYLRTKVQATESKEKNSDILALSCRLKIQFFQKIWLRTVTCFKKLYFFNTFTSFFPVTLNQTRWSVISRIEIM